jgi:TP901 family phage tail tape measure protein
LNAAVRINVRVAMGNALQQFERLRGELDRMERAAERAGNAGTRFGARVSGAFEQASRASRALAAQGRLLLYNFTLPLIAGFAALEREFLKNEKASALLRQSYQDSTGAQLEFGQTTGQVVRDLGTLDRIMLALSNTFGIAKSEVTGIAVTFARAGVSGVDLAKNTETALILMQGFQVEADSAAAAVVQLGTNYQLTGDQIRVGSAILSDAAQKTRADVNTLVASFVKAAPAASQLGIDVSHLAAMLAVMQQAGFGGATSGTALNAALTRMIKSTPEAIAVMKELGLALDESAFAAANGSDRFDMIVESLRRATGAQRQYAIAVLFGIQHQPKMTALIADAMREGGLYQQILEGQTNSTELLARQQNQLMLAMDNSATKFQVMKTQLMNNFMVIANNLTPALLLLTNLLVEGSRWFARLGDTARGRTVQVLLILTGVALALIGPLLLLAGAIAGLVPAMALVGRMAAFMFGPWGIALAAVIVLVYRFRDAFIAAMGSLYRAVLVIAMKIYEALQWLNPFARHSPSLVERTRDGVAAMVGYWRGLKPILTLMDQSSAAVRRLTNAMAGFTAQQEKAELAKMRAAVTKVGGKDAGAAFDNLVAQNKKLSASLPQIEAQYKSQALVVDKAKAALDASNDSVKQAERNLDSLRAKRDALSDKASKMGDPEGLRSQATAAESMARSLLASGNASLAARFANQAKKMGDQATAAERVRAELESAEEAVKSQETALKSLTATRDSLQEVYDREAESLQALADGYRAVQEQIQANTSALQDMAAAAQAAIDATAKANGGGAGGVPEQFGASAGPDLTAFGEDALPAGMPKGSGGDLEAFLKNLNERSATMLGQLIGNPLDDIKNVFQKFVDDLRGIDRDPAATALAKNPLSAGGPVGGKGNIQGAKNNMDMGDQVSVIDRLMVAWERVRGPVDRLVEAVQNVWDTITGFVGDVVSNIGGNLRKTLDGLQSWWGQFGDSIGAIIGVVIKLFADWYAFLVEIADWMIKTFGPFVVRAIDGIMGALGGILSAIGGLIGMVVSLLTGQWSDAWEGAKQVMSGLWTFLVNAAKAALNLLVLAIVGFVVWLGGTALGLLGTALGTVGRFFVTKLDDVARALGGLIVKGVEAIVGLGAKMVEAAPGAAKAILEFFVALPGRLWQGFKDAFGPAWDFVKYIGELMYQYAPEVALRAYEAIKIVPSMMWDAVKWGIGAYWDFMGFLGAKLVEWGPGVAAHAGNFAKKIPGWLWDGLRVAWNGAWKLVEFIGEKLVGYGPGTLAHLGNFGKKIPGWIWDGLKFAWNGAVKLTEFIGGKIAEYTPVVLEKFTTFAKKIPGWLWDGIKSAWAGYWKFGEFIGGKIAEYTPVVLAKFVSFGKSIPGWLWDGVKAIFGKTFKLGEEITDAGQGAINSTRERIIEMGRDIIRGLVSGVKAMAGNLAQSAIDTISGAINKAKSFFGIKSPSRVAAAEIGAPLMAGIAMGITGDGTVAAALTDQANRALRTARNLQWAEATLPMLTQMVQLQYANAPLTSLPGVTTTAPLSAMGGMAGTGGSGGDTNIEINVTQEGPEVADPFATASAIGFAFRTRTGR